MENKNVQSKSSCYRFCLKFAEENEIESIVFCCISTGVLGFTQEREAKIAVETVQKYYQEIGSKIKVALNIFKNENLSETCKLR